MHVRGPLFSTEAHGTIADTLTYRQRGTRAYVMKKRTHDDAQSQSQLNQRAHMIDAARLWRIMSEADRTTFAQSYQLPHQSPFSVWNQYIINRQLINPNWMHPLHSGRSQVISPYRLILTNEILFGNLSLDISGNARHWNIAPYTTAQGNRGQAADVEGALTTGLVSNSALMGDMDALTITFRYLPDYDQDDKPNHESFFYYYTSTTHTGTNALAYGDSTHWQVGDGTQTVSFTTYSLFSANVWTDYLFTFDSNDSGRGRIYINGHRVCSITSALTHVESNTRTLTVGRHPWGANCHGLIDNLAIYPGATNYLEP